MESCKKTIEKIKPLDKKEAEDKKAILAWFFSGEPIYREENPEAHLCAYFPLVDPGERKMFLVYHKKSGLWLPNGGHVERGESLEQTVVRELKEELGIDWKGRLEPFFASRITTVGKTRGHLHNDIWFLVNIDQSKKLAPDKSEFHDWGWFFLEEVVKKSSEPNIRRAIRKIKLYGDGGRVEP